MERTFGPVNFARGVRAAIAAGQEPGSIVGRALVVAQLGVAGLAGGHGHRRGDQRVAGVLGFAPERPSFSDRSHDHGATSAAKNSAAISWA